MKKRLTFFTVSSLILVLAIGGLVYALNMTPNDSYPHTQDFESEKAELDSAIEGLETEIEKNRTLYEEESVKLSIQEQELIELQQEAYNQSLVIEETAKAIDAKKEEIEIKQKEVEEAQKDVEDQIKILRQRLRTMYKFGKTGYLQILLKSDSLINAMTRLDRVRLLTQYDKELLASLKLSKEKLVIAKGILEKEEAELEVLQEEQIKQKEALETTYEQVLVKKKQTLANIDALNRQKQQLEKEQAFFDEQLQDLISKQEYKGGAMGWPLDLEYNYITSFFGPRRVPIAGASTNHGAIDIAVPTGQNIYSVLDGVVILSNYSYGYGNYVVVDHGGGITTLYAHASERYVYAGDSVSKGQAIAAAGSTGISTGPHLHFEVRVNGTRIDPLEYVVIP